ncbi:MAG: AAA family ATPase [Actinomycetota bacterium]|nr:AAA family ATPase [Actinomycetota bacterium]
MWPRPPRTRVLAVVNHKGGVGKTTTVVNLGAWLALHAAKVLVVDLDPQANATTGLGIDNRRVAGNIYQVLVEGQDAEDAIEATAVRNLYCIPSTIDLAGAEIELVTAFSRELRLKRALEPVAAEFDYVLVDCPPSLGLLTINALTASAEVVVPIQCEYYALEGLGQLLKNINLVKANLNPALGLSGIVLTMFDRRTRLAEQVAKEVRAHFPGKVFSTVIPRSVRLSEAPSFGQPVALYAPLSSGAAAYHSLAMEVAGVAAETPAQGWPHEAGQGPNSPRSADEEPPAPRDEAAPAGQEPADAPFGARGFHGGDRAPSSGSANGGPASTFQRSMSVPHVDSDKAVGEQ